MRAHKALDLSAGDGGFWGRPFNSSSGSVCQDNLVWSKGVWGTGRGTASLGRQLVAQEGGGGKSSASRPEPESGEGGTEYVGASSASRASVGGGEVELQPESMSVCG